MAQTGYTPISIYYSATSTNVPTAGNLVAGELAINTADGKLFYKDSSGVVQVIGTKGGVGSSSNTQVLYNSSGLVVGSSNFVFDGTNVGIGVSSPSNLLDVRKSANSNVISSLTNVNTGTSAQGIFIISNSTNSCNFAMTGSNYTSTVTYDRTDSSYVQSGGVGGLSLGATNASGIITFNTGGNSERMRIDSSGNLFIFATAGSSDSLNANGFKFGNGTFKQQYSSGFDFQQYYTTAGQSTPDASIAISTNTYAIKVNGSERIRIDSNGNLFVGGTTQNNSNKPVYASTTAKAWVSFNSTSTILSSFNVSSVTNTSTGNWTVTFTTAMPNSNYAAFFNAQPTVTNAGSDTWVISPTTSASAGLVHYETGILRNTAYGSFVVFAN